MTDAGSRMAIGWQVGVASGWGTYGLNLAIQLIAKGIEPVLPFLASTLNVTEAQAIALKSALDRHGEYAHWLKQGGGVELEFPLLIALGDGLEFPSFLDNWRGQPDIGVVFFESARVPPENIKRASELAAIITGSTWNKDVLEAAGFGNVFNCPQGIDPAVFHPAQGQGRFGDRFVIFSGGKLEYRKGQDLVVAAFKKFQARHPEALLVTAWHNPWPQAAQSLTASPHIEAMPGLDVSGKLDITGWLEANGLSPASFVDLGPLANAETPEILREADLAIFPNRCEGGTNLVAMECMACGVPVVLSRNTGHLDLFGNNTCYGLDLQIPLGEVTGRPDLNGWGESSIDELVNRMEEAFTDFDGRRKKAEAGAAFMAEWSWSRQTDRFLEAVAAVS